MTSDLLSSYIRAWSRHRVFIALASPDAALRSGLAPAEAARLFGAVPLELSLLPVASPASPSVSWLAAVRSAGGQVDVVVEDEALVYRFPYGHRDPERRGELNPAFLQAEGLAARLLPVLDGLAEQVRLVVLRPAPLYRTEALPFGELLGKLDGFLARLPRPYRFALEPAGAELLRPEYFACLRARGVAHVFGEGEGLLHTLPGLSEQLAAPGAPSAGPVCVVRSRACVPVPGLSWPGPDPAARRRGWCDAVRRCLSSGMPLYLSVDDERDPLRALGRLLELLNEDLARRSVFRRRAA